MCELIYKIAASLLDSNESHCTIHGNGVHYDECFSATIQWLCKLTTLIDVLNKLPYVVTLTMTILIKLHLKIHLS